MTARKTLTLEGQFVLHRGGRLHAPVIAYETWGRLDRRRDNAVLVFTGMSPSAHAASSPEDPAPGWWEEMIGPGKPIDTQRYFVICVNSLGSCFGSTGPASINPETGQPFRLDFPVLSLEDVAEAAWQVVRSLGVRRLHTVVGPSMGGMSALALLIRHPGCSRGLLSISSAARAEPFAIALRSLQREMVRQDPEWKGGSYAPGRGPLRGMRMARKLGMITYRSAEEWRQRFGRERIAAERVTGDAFDMDFEVESYLESHAVKFTGEFDANCYLYLSRAMDLFDVADHGGSVAAGLAGLQLERALVIGMDTDFLFPVHQQRELADALAAPERTVEFLALPSIQGHDAFLVDMDRLRPPVARFLQTERGG
ncbi:MAG: homoserine O-acetyltransferase [Gammaproteobacteria bacterium]|nr:homoserine O-acetyltransferase [Gammaproteobacteria bacterium]